MKELVFASNPEVLRICGNVFEVDMDNLEVIEVFEKFRQDVIAVGKELQSGKNTIETIKAYCEVSIQAAENILGEGSAECIFGEAINFSKCNQFAIYMLEAYTEHWNKSTSDINTRYNTAVSVPVHKSFNYKNKNKH